ncbi:MAG: tetratricopeptide repeat protein [Actinomycetota bacterium]|nr:tetratricopeptide repeat protein [Actinomycetota bacterium]
MSTSSAGTSDPIAQRQAAIASLEEQLGKTPRASRPYEHAALAYRLGLAYSESPVGPPADGLRKALACYEVAAGIFNPEMDPVQHARVLNAAGAAHRALGDRRRAVKLFEEAVGLFDGRDRDGEHAAALNNLGLTRTELGEPKDAIAAFDLAIDLFDSSTPDGARGRIAALDNRGRAHSALGTEEGLEAALADFEEARNDIDPEDAPYHNGLVAHSMGVTFSALAALRQPGEEERTRFLQEATRSFTESLAVFTRTSFPFQHALAKYNLGLAWYAMGGLTNLRRALASFEDAVGILDTRVHADAWRQAYASLERVEKELEPLAPGLTRAEQFAALVGDVPREERESLVTGRLLRILAQPDARRPMTELSLAIAKLGDEAAQVIEAELDTIMQITIESQEICLQAIFDAHTQLTGEARQGADRALDKAIGEALGGPQRLFVRDFLYDRGWERP